MQRAALGRARPHPRDERAPASRPCCLGAALLAALAQRSHTAHADRGVALVTAPRPQATQTAKEAKESVEAQAAGVKANIKKKVIAVTDAELGTLLSAADLLN